MSNKANQIEGIHLIGEFRERAAPPREGQGRERTRSANDGVKVMGSFRESAIEARSSSPAEYVTDEDHARAWDFAVKKLLTDQFDLLPLDDAARTVLSSLLLGRATIEELTRELSLPHTAVSELYRIGREVLKTVIERESTWKTTVQSLLGLARGNPVIESRVMSLRDLAL